MGVIELALISSVSPTTLGAVLFLLGGRNGLRHAWIFVAGELLASFVSGVLVAVGIGDLGIHVNGVGGGDRFPVAYVAGGVLLIAFAGYVLWRHRRARAHPHPKDRAREDQRLDRMVESSWTSFLVGLVFGLPSVWYALALAETSGSGWAYALGTVVVFTVISCSWGWAPIAWFMADPTRALSLLTRMRAAIDRHRIAIIVTVLVLVGGYLIAFGLVTA